MDKHIKIIDPGIAKEKEIDKVQEEKESVRLLKNPTHFDKLESNKTGQLHKKDIVTRKIRREFEEMLRYYKFRHPNTGLMLFGEMLKSEEMTPEVISWGGVWISPEEYYENTNPEYKEMIHRGKIKRVQSLLDIEIVRASPALEKKIKARG